MAEKIECLQDGPECRGEVRMRDVGRPDGKVFPRCEFHFQRRLAAEREIRELTAPSAPAWFDPMDAGEAWSEDDY